MKITVLGYKKVSKSHDHNSFLKSSEVNYVSNVTSFFRENSSGTTYSTLPDGFSFTVLGGTLEKHEKYRFRLQKGVKKSLP